MTEFRKSNFKGARIENCIKSIEGLLQNSNEQLERFLEMTGRKEDIEYYRGRVSMANTILSLLKTEFDYDSRKNRNIILPRRVEILQISSTKPISNKLDEFEIIFEIKGLEGVPLCISYYRKHEEWSKVDLPVKIEAFLTKSQLQLFEDKLNTVDLHKQLWERLSTETEHRLISLYMDNEKTKESS